MAAYRAAHDKAWEIWGRIQETKAVYVKDLAIRTAPLMWAMGRHGGRFMAEAMARSYKSVICASSVKGQSKRCVRNTSTL